MTSSCLPVHGGTVLPLYPGAGTERWKRRCDGSSLLTCKQVPHGISEVRKGRKCPPATAPHQAVVAGRKRRLHFGLRDPLLTDVICDDYVEMFLQHSTHWDALTPVGSFFDGDGDGVDEKVFRRALTSEAACRFPAGPSPATPSVDRSATAPSGAVVSPVKPIDTV